ncbi:MAG TPA: toll/interleukin-1 receptor domain-containing protein [Ktedonobacterales bacterium]
MVPKVFISHSHEDNAFCRAFVSTLHELGIATWYDEQSLGAGAVRRGIEEGLPTCESFIVILSPAALQSPWVSREIDAAIHLENRGKLTILPVVAQPCEVPLMLSGYKRVEGVSDPAEAARLAHQLLVLGEQTESAAEPRVKVVVSPDDPDLDQFLALYRTLFPIQAERATPEDMVRYIEESQVEKAKPAPDFLEELVLVKSREQVVAFLNYTFYYSSRYVFVSYIGNVSGERASARVIGALLAYFKRVMLEQDCKAIVFEVESKRITPRGEIARIRRFRRYLRSYANMANTNCYEILFDFVQPYLMIEEVQDDPGKLHEWATQLRRSSDALRELGVAKTLSLGVIPLQPGLIAGTTIRKGQLMTILRFVYEQVYGDSFTDDPADDRKYKAYMRRLIRYYERTLPRAIPVRAEGTS